MKRQLRHLTEAARIAASAARKAKREGLDTLGLPELFIVRVNGHAFTWELRRFGGVLLERGIEAHASEALARADGEMVLATLSDSPGLPSFKRELSSKVRPGS